MAVTTVTYNAAATSIAVTSWDTDLTTGLWASSAVVDNTTNKYIDALVGGQVLTGTGFVAGDTFDIYVWGNYDTGTSTDIGGGIGALFAGTDQVETEGTDFQGDNMTFMVSLNIDQASITYNWGPVSVAQHFGGVLPEKWGLLAHNNGTGTMAATPNCSYTGITYTST